MEELLNKLIEKGWKPRGKNVYNCCDNAKRIWYEGGEESYRDYIEITPRKLTSKESGLWQFVCENGMIKHEVYEDIQSWEHTTADHSDFWYTSGDNYEYRLIEASLKDESELESFILENITIKGTK